MVDPRKSGPRFGELWGLLAGELAETRESENSVLLVTIAGKSVVKVLLCPSQALDARDGPTLLPSAERRIILAVVSNETVAETIDDLRQAFADKKVLEIRWRMWLQELCAEILEKSARRSSADDPFDQLLPGTCDRRAQEDN